MNTLEISKIYGFTPQTIRRSIKKGRLKASKVDYLWKISENDYKEFLKSKYVRHSPIFNKELENLSPKDCAKLLDCSLQSVYYNLRKGYLKSSRFGVSWVINLKDLNDYKNKFSQKINSVPHKIIGA